MNKRGFTLLEVLLTLGILVTIVTFVSSLVRSSFDIRFALSEQSTVTHRLNLVVRRITYDLSHAFILSSTAHRVRVEGKKRTLFKVENKGDSDKLSMTYMGHAPVQANSHESDQSYVVYEVQDSKKFPGRKNLMRGEHMRVPDSFREDPPMQILAANVHSIKIDLWDGDGWSKGAWDSTNGDTANFLPSLARVTVKVWVQDPLDAGSSTNEAAETSFAQFSTIVFLPNSLDFNEKKDRVTSYRLFP